ncbi:MAG: hybrid sensor histidine kinase/response regulator [Synechococcales cyanobacterium CRU_2_2]|nr:hybrid sensor histidine kinase/response regulator [Synechococcales cyanobacterium CRU_2_2]
MIGRNALNLRLSRVQSSVELLRDRVQNVEASNYELRTFQDQVTTAGVVPQARTRPPVSAVAIAPETHQNSHQNSHPSAHLEPRRPGRRPPPLHRADYSGDIPYFDVLEKDHYSDLHLLSQAQMENVVQLQEVATDIDLGLAETQQVARSLNQTLKQLQLKVTQTRMRPLADLMGRFPRMMRDLSVEYGKSVELKSYGGGTLIDRAILEALSDPLLHLLRNGFDHGIEQPEVRAAQGKPAQGLIEIRAAHRGSQTIIQVRDDGAGINLDKIRARAYEMGISTDKIEQATEAELLNLIFEPGFSTAELVTDLSGRGVGMDVVRTNLQQVRGEVKVETYPGEGTLFTLSVPFTLSVLRVLVVESQGLVIAFPTDEIAEMVFPEPEVLCTSAGQTLLHWNDQMVPILNLGQYLRFNCPQRSPETQESPKIDVPSVLVLRQGKTWIGLQIDRFWGEQEVAVRPIEGILPLPQGFAGSTILGDGRVVPLVDTERLLERLSQASQPRTSQLAATQLAATQLTVSEHEPSPVQAAALASPGSHRGNPIGNPMSTPSQRPTVMVVDDSVHVRRFLALNLERVGYQVIQATDGQDAMEKLTKSRKPVNAMVCDLEMPRLDGYGVLSEVRSHPQWKALPVIMLTSRSSEKHRRLAMNLGASAYFSKPYNEQVLLGSLQSLLQSALPL